MKTDIDEIRNICAGLEHEKLLDYYAMYSRYTREEYIKIEMISSDDKHYVKYENYKRIRDACKAELMRRLRGCD